MNARSLSALAAPLPMQKRRVIAPSEQAHARWPSANAVASELRRQVPHRTAVAHRFPPPAGVGVLPTGTRASAQGTAPRCGAARSVCLRGGETGRACI